MMIAGTTDSTGSAELFDPLTDTWHSAGNMSSDRRSFTATLLRDGRVLVAGSSILGMGASKSAEGWQP
jgi:hypothetical protein